MMKIRGPCKFSFCSVLSDWICLQGVLDEASSKSVFECT